MIGEVFSDSLKTILSEKSTENIELLNIGKEFNGLIVAGVAALNRENIIWVNKEGIEINPLKRKLEMWLKFLKKDIEVLTYTLPFSDPYISNILDTNFFTEKNNIINAIKNNKQIIILTNLVALNIKSETREEIRNLQLNIAIGDKINRDFLISELISAGYEFQDYVENSGEIAKRGGVIDIFPIGFERPVRLEIFGNELSAITSFDTESRLSTGSLKKCEIPLGNILKNNNFSDYYKKDNLIFLDELLEGCKYIISNIDGITEEFSTTLKTFKKLYELAGADTDLPEPQELFSKNLYKKGFIDISSVFDEIEDKREFVKKKNLNEYDEKDIKNLSKNNVFIFSKTSPIYDKIRELGVDFNILPEPIPFSFINTKTNTVFLTDKEAFFKKSDSKINISKRKEVIDSIIPGDYIVHEIHGIGVFLDFIILKLGNNEQEFLKIEFAEKAILYVPTYDAEVLAKYSAFNAAPPKLDKIGGKTWKLKQNRAKKSIMVFVRELLYLYARRKAIKGTAYTGDKDLEHKLADSFPYIETPDQEKAIREVLEDLNKNYPMERLVCGDVSFGKTEVAIRAAFRVVSEGRQVAVLCPTTILADQHFKTFKERMNDFPINIEKLSRMVEAKKRKKIVQDVNSGKVDILIGTHAIISKSVLFKKLGLFIIDEEQRFGVFQKEQLKKNREDIDVLILSATPIPRTLSLSFAGLADITTITTPPPGRMSIKNYIGKYSKKIVISAILREIERDGSVFIVYNSIEKLYSFKNDLNGWLPDIPMTIIHAKMGVEDINAHLSGFINGKYKVLISTTIIENGIDIPNVNTMIIIDAHRFGLTQLYQLRGRIGRGKRQAYAYFLIRGDIPTEKAQLRLNGIRDYSEIGSGFKIAEYDLKLRGAGALLGNKQHGHIEALGFEYYNNLLKRTIEELKGETRKKWDGKITVNINFSIDKDYISNNRERMKFYTDISSAETVEELNEIKDGITGIYGKPSREIEKIYFIAKIKLISKALNCKRTEINSSNIIFELSDSEFAKIIFSSEFIDKYSPEIKSLNTVSFKTDDFLNFPEELLKELN